MSTDTTEGFLLLASTLLSSLTLSSTGRVDNVILLQLSAIFGPMLTSALQLVDKGEVVRIRLPFGRELYQVASSSGMPYTLHTTLPPLLPPFEQDDEGSEMNEDPSTTSPPDISGEQNTPPPNGIGSGKKTETRKMRELQWEQDSLARTRALAKGIERMYCPCAGFMYNALAGERNYLCKHLLAVIIAHQMEREVRTEVGLGGMIGLLGLNA